MIKIKENFGYFAMGQQVLMPAMARGEIGMLPMGSTITSSEIIASSQCV
jgi:hypothetical protein